MLLAKHNQGVPAATPAAKQIHHAASASYLGRHAARVSLRTRGLKENVAKLASIDAVKEVQISGAGSECVTILNAPGKKASVAIYAHLAARHGSKIDAAAAEEGLQLYGEYVAEAVATPESHPNIDLLLRVKEQQQVLDVKVVLF